MKRINYYIYFLLFIVCFIVYNGVLSHVPFYHEQHHLFLFSKAYFLNTIHSEGFLSYLTNFIIQFFYYPWLGSFILALSVSSTYLLTALSIKRLTKHIDYLHLGLLPTSYLFLQTLSVDYNFSEVVATCIVLKAIFIASWLPGKWIKNLMGISFCLLLALIISPQIIGLSLLLIALGCLSAHLGRSFNPKTSIIISLLSLICFTSADFYLFIHKYNMKERRMIQAQKSAQEKQWTEVLETTEKYFKAGHANHLMMYYHNMALFHSGKMIDRLFDYPQNLGVESLFLPWKSDSRETEFGHLIYEELGHWNEAQRWAFEAMVVWGETAPHLTNLIKYNIKIGRKEVAQKFINILKQSLFYSDTAEKLERELTNDTKPTENELTEVQFINILNIKPELIRLCNQNPHNQMAFEYLMSSFLLSNQVSHFAENLYRMKKFNYPKMPACFEEALYLYKLGKSEAFEKMKLTISSETEQRFREYYQLYNQGDTQQLKDRFGHTYWFYLHFISPYGNKIIE